VIDYYAAIRRISQTPFDVPKAAKLELEWWIVHRESRVPVELDAVLANLAAEMYQTPADRFSPHWMYRAEAMILRDELADRNSMTDVDWQKIMICSFSPGGHCGR
jgi:hypothetical protein